MELGDFGYINKNCWLARNINYPPSKRCQYCQLKFNECLFARYLTISLILVFILLVTSYLVDRNIPKSLIVSLFVLIIVYGYFFSRSTESIIEAHFAERKSKEAFQELSDHLQQKVDEQTKEIKGAYEVEKKAHEELKELDEAKNQFMMITQHHLRTPLSVTMGYLDLLLNGVFGKIPKKSVEVLNKSQESIKKEIQIINDLLNVSQVQMGKGGVKKEPGVSVKKMVEEIVKDLKPQADRKSIYLKLETLGDIPDISADKNQLTMALTNIVDNAIGYTNQGGVDVKLKIDNKKIKIAVKDTGIGISKNELNDLFDKSFQRGQQAQKINVVGKGIGLYLSANIINAHGGKIWAESEGEGKGSAFFIELPTEPATG